MVGGARNTGSCSLSVGSVCLVKIPNHSPYPIQSMSVHENPRDGLLRCRQSGQEELDLGRILGNKKETASSNDHHIYKSIVFYVATAFLLGILLSYSFIINLYTTQQPKRSQIMSLIYLQSFIVFSYLSQ